MSAGTPGESGKPKRGRPPKVQNPTDTHYAAFQVEISNLFQVNGVPLPATAGNAQLFNAMPQMGMGELDNPAVIGVIEALTGVELKTSF